MTVTIQLPREYKLGYDPWAEPVNQAVPMRSAYISGWDGLVATQGMLPDNLTWQWENVPADVINYEIIAEVLDATGSVTGWPAAIMLGDTVNGTDILPASIPDSIAEVDDGAGGTRRISWNEWPGVVDGIRTVEDPDGVAPGNVAGDDVDYVLCQPSAEFPGTVLFDIENDDTADMTIVSQTLIADLTAAAGTAATARNRPNRTG